MTRFNIINGPSKHELSVAFFYKPKAVDRLEIYFDLDKNSNDGTLWVGDLEIKIILTQLTWEHSSGDDWLFEGHTPPRKNWGMPENKKVKGYFNTQTRKGWIEVIN